MSSIDPQMPLDPKEPALVTTDPLTEQGGYWRSLADLDRKLGQDSEEAKELEAKIASEFPESGPYDVSGVSRRRFLQLMSASVALATATGCRWEKQEIVPFKARPEGRTPGTGVQYATSMELGGLSQALLITNIDGRPIKVEGNPDLPQHIGASSVYAQASMLEMYDPDRSKGVARSEGGKLVESDWTTFSGAIRPTLISAASGGGANLSVLAQPSESPSFVRMKARFQAKYPQAQWYEYAPLHFDNVDEGSVLAFGKRYRSHYDLENADVVLALDSDFLLTHPDALRLAAAWSERRDPDGSMNRVYAVESSFSSTGGNADHRLPLRSDQIPQFLLALEIAIGGGDPGSDGVLADAGTKKFLLALAKDLAAHKGRSLLIPGEGQSPFVHAVAHRVNAALGNVGKTLRYEELGEARPRGTEQLASLCDELEKGSVGTLLILGGNPVFDAPADIPFAAALAKAKKSVHLSLYRDETSRACSWHLPEAHFLESWGDGRTYSGVYCSQQPQILPLFGGKSRIEVLAFFAAEAKTDGRSITRATFDSKYGISGEGAFRRMLHDGFVPAQKKQDARPSLRSIAGAAPAAPASAGIQNGELELTFAADSKVYDGRFANNAWLQELPDFMTKLTWDNALLVGPATAAALGLVGETMATVSAGSLSMDLPVYILPGQAKGSLTVKLGYGRRESGVVGGSVSRAVTAPGFDVNKLRSAKAFDHASKVSVKSTGVAYSLASTQDHFGIDEIGQRGTQERLPELVRSRDLEQYKEEPDFAKHEVHHPELVSLFESMKYDGKHAWAMTIDLNKCIGCNACVASCTSENNVPVVGKEQVLRNREMHWLRIDRYFGGNVDAPTLVHQPVGCSHCENAPCEQVCPVAATTHSSEGLNDMIYNRCVGTRYCGNNCPFKVRRFNYFNYFKEYEKPHMEVAKLHFNPEVTVRARGVMEKCTYCVQRIKAATIPAKNEGRDVQDGEIQTACEQACPTSAIVFGDLKNEKSRVKKLADGPRAYQMLAELNIRPRTRFLAKVRNANPELVTSTPKQDDHD